MTRGQTSGEPAQTGETCTQALTSPAPRMDRDSTDGVTATLAFAELMAAGGRAARAAGDGGLPAAVAAVRTAVLPLWSRTAPEAARDVLVACADLAVTRRHVIAVPDELGENLIANEMLDLTAGWAADERPARAGGRFTPPVAYASSCAFDRDEDAAVLDAVCLLLTLAHPAGDVDSPEDWQADDRVCPECGGDPQGTYGCSCFDPSACQECGDNTGRCDCWGVTDLSCDPDVVALVGRGLAVFPLPAGSKAAEPGWQHACTSDLAVLARSWPARANIGVGCRASGVAGLDLDRHTGGPDGVTSFARLCADLGMAWPVTFTVATPTRGLHLYFWVPPGFTVASVIGWLPGADVRGPGRRFGGYLAGPGSVVGGRRYEVVADVPIAGLPGWLGNLLVPPV